jgi:hypothetical protein
MTNALIAALLMLIPLSAPFEEAEATATSLEEGLQIEVSVIVEGSPVAVVVRGTGPGGSDLPPVALANRAGGLWEGIVRLPAVENILLAFEMVPSAGQTTLSDVHTLTELGVDPAIFSLDNPDSGFGEDDEPLVTPEGARWGWLGLAAGAAALALLAFWTIGSVRSRDGDPGDESEDVEGSAEWGPIEDD